jgi:hypothetical protein
VSDITRLSAPHIFYPFGSTTATSFAITEEETLDYLCQLLAEPQLRDLLNAISQCHLLFIGCNFPDWLTRFWIRALAGERVWNRMRDKFEYIADQRTHHDRPLVMFLNRVAARVLTMKASDFVGELYARWNRRRASDPAGQPRAALPPRPENPYVFISYAHEDKWRVATLKQRLEEIGLVTWFDDDRMRAGDHIRSELRDRIEKCTLFMPILSKHVRRREGYFREEWHYAEARLLRIRRHAHFIVPVIVDDLPDRDDHAGAPEAFWALSCQRIIDGAATSDFCRHVQRLIREAQE